MKQLTTLKQKFGNRILTNQAIANTKGGLRFETTNYVEFVTKLTSLGGQGVCVCWEKHGDTYCIEW